MDESAHSIEAVVTEVHVAALRAVPDLTGALDAACDVQRAMTGMVLSVALVEDDARVPLYVLHGQFDLL